MEVVMSSFGYRSAWRETRRVKIGQWRSLAPARSTEKSETELKLIQKNIRYDNSDDNEVMGSTFVFYSSILFEKRQMKDCERFPVGKRLKNQKSSHLSCSLRLIALKNNEIAGLENPYYHNTVFTKTSHMIDKDNLILEMAIGSRSNKRSWSMMKGSQKERRDSSRVCCIYTLCISVFSPDQ